MTVPRTASRQRGFVRWRGPLVHGLRVLLFAAIVLLIHRQHQLRQTSLGRAHSLPPPPLDVVRKIMPAAEQVRVSSEAPDRYDVLDAAGDVLVVIVQTSPESDAIIGFSGPTNVMIAFDDDEHVRGVAVLESRDTREHVRQVEQDPQFLKSWEGLSWEEAGRRPRVDAVSGATLTSLAIAESIAARLGGPQMSLRFPEPLTLDDVRRLFPQAEVVTLHPQRAGLWNVADKAGKPLGDILRTTPAADNLIGYQGPSDARVAVDQQGRVVGLQIGPSYDNEPYVDYVRQDMHFLQLFNGRTLEELATLDLRAAGVEGVSGATMTSQAVAAGIVLAAAAHQRSLAERIEGSAPKVPWSLRDVGTVLVTLTGTMIGLTALRRRRWVRVPFQLVLIGYLGFINGDMVSQALLVGWAQHGVPWRTMLGPLVLTIAAFAVPITTKRNVYCTHLCPHGALQQLLMHRIGWQWHPPQQMRRLLSWLPGLLLLWVVIVAMSSMEFSLVDIEPFDAYLYPVAGWATICVALVGLAASLFVPMAYCRYGCPTGAALNYVRRHSRSGELSWRDVIALGCLCVALALWWTGK